MKPAICLEPLFPDLPAEARVARVAAEGFRAVEFWGWRDKDLPALARACADHGVEVVNFSGHRVGSPIAAATHPALLADVADALAAARQLRCGQLMLLTNALGDGGRVLDRFEEIPEPQKVENAVAGLRAVLAAAPPDVRWVLEPLNTRIDHPGYWLSGMAAAAALVSRVGDPRLGILCDLYHLAVMGEDPAQVIDEHLPVIGHFHVADVPGRHEPGTGAVPWLDVLRRLDARGYQGHVGFEFFPAGDHREALRAVRRLCEAV